MTPAAPEPPSSTPPLWRHCGHGTTATSPVGCRGIHVPGRIACLAHLNEADRAAYLSGLAPGADIDHRGTPFTEDLLDRLLDALRDPDTERLRFGAARFDQATFTGPARFGQAAFDGGAAFDGATFTHAVWFDGATFNGIAGFNQVIFSHAVWFDRATFNGAAAFGQTVFTGTAGFNGATFASAAQFPGAAFTRDAVFSAARFQAASWLGPLVCGGTVKLDAAVFETPVTMMITARGLSLWRTRWASTATLRLRHTEVDLSEAMMEYPVTVAAEPAPLTGPLGIPLPEEMLAGQDAGVRVTNLSGVDAAHLALHDVDLSGCRFAGAVHLDQLRVDGWCTFGTTPTGTGRYGRLPWRWSPRRTLVEEHHWRARTRHSPARPQGWTPPPEGIAVLQPAALAALYRQLRKSLEDGKNEPDAADFYYGEMEMRRHDATRPRAERALLTVYAALSGYGLRASRALVWLLAAMAVTLLALVLWGLPVGDPKPQITGRQTGPDIALTADTPDPVNPSGPYGERVSTERFEKALRVVINSVVFRSSGQDLTTAGTYTEMASRLVEPVLLGLAVLAVRGRVKR